VLANVLNALSQNVELSDHDDGDGSVCFNNPVAFDLADTHGVKVAGAGQRRTRHGLLHQGSIRTELDTDLFGQEFASQLASKQETWLACESFEEEVVAIAADRYATAEWLGKK
jgi:lipoate-protein ligase A